jgi:hypothetical protein
VASPGAGGRVDLGAAGPFLPGWMRERIVRRVPGGARRSAGSSWSTPESLPFHLGHRAGIEAARRHRAGHPAPCRLRSRATFCTWPPSGHSRPWPATSLPPASVRSPCDMRSTRHSRLATESPRPSSPARTGSRWPASAASARTTSTATCCPTSTTPSPAPSPPPSGWASAPGTSPWLATAASPQVPVPLTRTRTHCDLGRGRGTLPRR